MPVYFQISSDKKLKNLQSTDHFVLCQLQDIFTFQ
jgi:hypothetical protein